jgi:hypothetical protein
MKLRAMMIAVGGAIAVSASPMITAAYADSISGVESARAKERQGRYLNRGDREELRRYGGNDDYRWRARYRDYDYDYYDGYGPGVGVYVGPGGVGIGY